MKYAKRVDLNQKEIVEKFKNLGYSVAHTHTVHKGFPDILVAKNGVNSLVEIKNIRSVNDKAEDMLTPSQEKFHENWQAPIFLITSVYDVILFDQVRSHNESRF